MRVHLAILLLPLLLLSCSNGDSSPEGSDTTQPDVGAADLLADGGTPDVPSPADLVTEDLAPQGPTGPESRGWQLLRGVVHLHSALSHDGCGPNGYEDFGGPDPACVDELRAAPCTTAMDFLMMTDHPGYSQDHSFEDVVQYREEAGDELLYDELERPFANRIHCGDGSLVDHFYVFGGTEGSKQMPIGMAGPIPKQVYQTSFGDSEPLESAQEAMALVHEQGGYGFACHTEEKSISVERIVELPLDGMEIYNLHANLMAGLESMDSIFAMDRFMPGSENPPDCDLAVLLFLSEVAKDVEKFDLVAPQVRISHIAATDIHRNVEIPALCPDGIEGSLCEAFAEDYPNFAQFATVGGPVPLADGDRIDSYARSFRWFANYALVKEHEPQDIREAIGKGRSFSAFDLFGRPTLFDFFVDRDVVEHGEGGDADVDPHADEADADMTVVEMGEETPFVEGMVARFNVPRLEATAWRADAGWDYDQAQLTCRLIRADASGSTVLLEASEQGSAHEVPLDAPGAYRVQCDIVPKHVAVSLEEMTDLAKKTFPYIYSNAIFLRAVTE
jgi:hypothetical protein